MSEIDKVQNIIKGIDDDAFMMLLAKNAGTVVEVITMCQNYEELRRCVHSLYEEVKMLYALDFSRNAFNQPLFTNHTAFYANVTGSLSSESRERYHSLVSVQGGLHSCRQCTYVTKYSASMRRHLRKHTGERPFQCHLCPAVFNQTGHLARHIRTHTGERPFSCDVCSASFSERSNLMKHMHIHTGKRPYSCDVCNTSFLQKAHLITHMRTHSRELPYSCDQCSASFSQKNSLVRHMRNHTGERPFSCDHCNASFSQNEKLSLHVSRYHKTNRP
nr:oocyte zinc finger protein XlCOF6.1-like [Rhipicephalus microplus]